MAKKKVYKSNMDKLKSGVGMGKPKKGRKKSGAKKKANSSSLC